MLQKILTGSFILLIIALFILLTWAFLDLQKRNNPQRKLLQSAKTGLLVISIPDIYPDDLVNSITTFRQKWLVSLGNADKYLLAGKPQEAEKELDEIKKSIEKVSRGDASWFREDPKMFPSNPDKNGNGVSDWFEGVHGKIGKILEKGK